MTAVCTVLSGIVGIPNGHSPLPPSFGFRPHLQPEGRPAPCNRTECCWQGTSPSRPSICAWTGPTRARSLRWSTCGRSTSRSLAIMSLALSIRWRLRVTVCWEIPDRAGSYPECWKQRCAPPRVTWNSLLLLVRPAESLSLSECPSGRPVWQNYLAILAACRSAHFSPKAAPVLLDSTVDRGGGSVYKSAGVSSGPIIP